MKLRLVGFLLALSVAATPAVADVVVSLVVRDGAGNEVTGSVNAGAVLDVELLIAATGDDVPVEDVRLIQVDFGGTPAELEIGDFTWNLSSANYLLTASNNLPAATNLALSAQEDIFRITDEPVVFATLALTANASGSFTPLGGRAQVTAGFEQPITFMAGIDLTGDLVEISVSGGGGSSDTDADGVPDDVDAFPEDPDEAVDTDEDGTGDNADEDDDNDGVVDSEDEFPTDENEQSDADGDGVGDNTDVFPDDPGETVDGDGDGVGDNSDQFPSDPDRTELDDDNANSGPPAAGSFCGMAMFTTMGMIFLGLMLTQRVSRYSAARSR